MPSLKVPQFNHLQAASKPEAFAALADLQVRIADTHVPLHSAVLANESRLLCDVFCSTPAPSWAAGVATVLQGHRPAALQTVLALLYSTEGSTGVGEVRQALGLPAPPAWAEVEDALRLAHKLDAPRILRACETYAVGQWDADGSALAALAAATELDLERLRASCLDGVLERLLDRRGAWEDGQELTAAVGTAEEWGALGTEDLLILLRAMFRAKNKLITGRFCDTIGHRRGFLRGPLGGGGGGGSSGG